MKRTGLLILLCVFSLLLCTACGNNEELQKLVNMDPTSEEIKLAEDYEPAAINLMIHNLTTVEILKSNKKSASLKITAPNMYELMNSLYADDDWINKQDELYSGLEKTVKEKLESGQFTYVTKTVEVNIIETDGEKAIEDNFEYMDAMYGGLYTFYREIMTDADQ